MDICRSRLAKGRLLVYEYIPGAEVTLRRWLRPCLGPSVTIFEIDEMRSWPRWTWVFNIFDTLFPAELCLLGRLKESLCLPSVFPPRRSWLPKDGPTGDAGVIVIGGSADGVSSDGVTSAEFLGRADTVWFDIEP